MKKLLWIILLVVLAYVAWRWWRGPGETATADRGKQLFYDRIWVDTLPASERDQFHVFGAITEHSVGWFAERYRWKGEWEQFRFEPRGDGQVEILFPHSRTKSRLSYRAWKCAEKKEFDYCLEVSGGKGPKKYYSQRGWEVGTVDGARALEARLAAP
ncbi:MAG: hypothetical protein JWM53_2723 [bacterium]|nr:hypothetical protein [bacterium]